MPFETPKYLNVLFLEKHAEDARFVQALFSQLPPSPSQIRLKTVSSQTEAARHAALEPPHVMLLSTGSFDEPLPDGLAKTLAPAPDSAVVLLCEVGYECQPSDFTLPGLQDFVQKTRLDPDYLYKVLLNAYRLRRARAASLESQKVMRAVYNGSSDGLMHVSSSRLVSGVNASACRILESSEKELTGKPYEEALFRGRGRDRSAPAAALISQTLDDGIRRSAEKVCFFDSAGCPVWVQCTVQPIHEGARNSGAVIVFRSLADALQKEDKLKDAIQEQIRNEQRLVEALSELKKLNQQLRETQDQLIQAEKLQSVGRLAAGVAHEVKNPLAILMQGAEYLQQALPRGDSETLAVLEDMLDAVRRADAVIKGLLDFSAPAEAEMIEDHLPEVVEESLQLVRHLAVKNKVSVVKTFSQDLKPVVIDRNRMQQVFVNVLSNAIHAMKDGGELTISAQPEPERKGGRGVRVEILDTGTGIPVEILDKVFDPFVTTRRGKGGTGLGLSVVRGIMDLHQGEIRIENREDCRGAKVTLRF